MHESQFEFAEASKLYRRAQELDPRHASTYAFAFLQVQSSGYTNRQGAAFDDVRNAADAVLA